MHSVTLQETDGHLDELIELLDKGEEVELVRPGKPSLTIVKKAEPVKGKRRLGRYKGQPFYMSEDFNEPLPDEFWLGDDV